MEVVFLEEENANLLGFKRNIIEWYPFKENSKVLEIWEGKLPIEEIQSASFDYVAIIGLGEKSIFELIEFATSKLKEEGILLISVDNNIGINSLCTETTKKSQKINRNKLVNALIKYSFVNQKFYYPLPNYKYTNVLFTDDFLPNYETISRCITFYDNNTIVAMNERKNYKKILEEDTNLFKEFSNSFFVECSKEKLIDNNIKFVSFSNARRKEYRIKTIIQGDYVYKYSCQEESNEHINSIKKNIDILKTNNFNTIDSFEDKRIVSKYVDNKLLLNNVIISKSKEGKKQEIKDLICKFRDELINKYEKAMSDFNCFDKYNIEYNKEDIENLHFVKDGLWDMFFQNCFYIDNKFYFYDQEWIEENLPIEFIMYRATKYSDKELFEVISKEELYSLLNIKEHQIKLFEELDDILQKNIRDTDIWEIHKDNKEANRLLVKIDELQKEVINNINTIQKLENEIAQDKKKIKEKDDELNGIKNSRSWKLIQSLRGRNNKT